MNMFYIKNETDLHWDSEYSENQLGSISFSNFWAQDGFRKLKYNIDISNVKWLKQISIFDDQSKLYSIEDFLKKIEKCKIIDN